MLTFALVGCAVGTPALRSPHKDNAPALTLPVGDAAHGEVIFREGLGAAPSCISCHAFGTRAFRLGPNLVGIAARTAVRLKDEEGAAVRDYLWQSIVDPGAFIVPGYRGMMYPRYGELLTPQDIADLVAYLLTL
jgi:cytochrome c2